MSSADIPERALDWCIRNLPRALRITSAQRLWGGIDYTTHALLVERSAQPPLEVVLRRFTRPRTATWPNVAREVATLAALQVHFKNPTICVPATLAYDADGSGCGVPAILLSRVPGELDNRVEGALARIGELAGALVALHEARVPAPAEVREFRVRFERREEPVPPGVTAPDWKAAWRALERVVITPEQLLHSDYHIGNVLFEHGKLRGVVDWSAAASGPTALDVGYCRMDLALIFGVEASEVFLAAYENAAKQRVPDLPLWDLVGAVRAFPDPAVWLHGWHESGRVDLTADLLRERMALFVERALSRI